jgi:DNA-binding transcriptional MerR regulator
MQPATESAPLPPIPAKRYFTIGEVSELCGVKPHVLRYWEQEFTQLKPVKRRGNRRYYQHHEVLLIRRIRELLYQQGFTINGARHRLEEIDIQGEARTAPPVETLDIDEDEPIAREVVATQPTAPAFDWKSLRADLQGVLDLLRPALHS